MITKYPDDGTPERVDDDLLKSMTMFSDYRVRSIARELLALRSPSSEAKGGDAGSGVWQPIETAPRDSRRILVGYLNFEKRWVVHEAWWRMPYESAPAKQCYWCHDKDGAILSSDVHDGLGATHWQPLPAQPPSSAGRGEEPVIDGYPLWSCLLCAVGLHDWYRWICRRCGKETRRG